MLTLMPRPAAFLSPGTSSMNRPLSTGEGELCQDSMPPCWTDIVLCFYYIFCLTLHLTLYICRSMLPYNYSFIAFFFFLFEASLSEPQINRLYGAGCYGVLCVCWYINFGLRGAGATFSYTRAHHAHHVLGEKMAAARECFKFSHQSASNDYYMA